MICPACGKEIKMGETTVIRPVDGVPSVAHPFCADLLTPPMAVEINRDCEVAYEAVSRSRDRWMKCAQELELVLQSAIEAHIALGISDGDWEARARKAFGILNKAIVSYGKTK